MWVPSHSAYPMILLKFNVRVSEFTISSVEVEFSSVEMEIEIYDSLELLFLHLIFRIMKQYKEMHQYLTTVNNVFYIVYRSKRV